MDHIEYIIQHREGLLELLKPYLIAFLDEEYLFLDVPETFQKAYEEFFLSILFEHLTSTYHMGYDVLSDLEFRTITTIFELDNRGRF